MGGGRKSLFGFLGFKRVPHRSRGHKPEMTKRPEGEAGKMHPGLSTVPGNYMDKNFIKKKNYIDEKAGDYIEKVRARQMDSREQPGTTVDQVPIKRGTMIEVPIM